MLDEKQVVSGLIILLSFFVGYKYGTKVSESKKEKDESTSGKNGSFVRKTQNKPLHNQDLLKEKISFQVFSDYLRGDYKMVLVVRNDLKMGKGKIAAQCGHASVGAYEVGMKKCPQLVNRWNCSGSAKIAVKVESEQELNEIHRKAKALGLNSCVIRDAGRTQIEPNTKTVLAVGPGLVREIDQVTGHLKLL